MPLVSVSQRKEDGTPLLGIGEEMILALPGVECHFDPSGPSEGPGSLYVTTKNVIWLSSQGDKGYALDFPYIVMHAIAGAESSLYGGRACLYCQLDGDDLHEVAFIPSDPAALQGLYSAFSRGAMLNPDEEQEGEGDFYYNENEVGAAAATGERLEGMMDLSQLQDSLPHNDGYGEEQFEDGEEEGGMEDGTQ